MKINKQNLNESALTKEIEVLEETAETDIDLDTSDIDEDTIIDDIASASVEEIADAVQAAAEKASDDKETYSDTTQK